MIRTFLDQLFSHEGVKQPKNILARNAFSRLRSGCQKVTQELVEHSLMQKTNQTKLAQKRQALLRRERRKTP